MYLFLVVQGFKSWSCKVSNLDQAVYLFLIMQGFKSWSWKVSNPDHGCNASNLDHAVYLFFYKRKFLDNIQQFATKMVSTCNLTKQAYLYTIKRTIENFKWSCKVSNIDHARYQILIMQSIKSWSCKVSNLDHARYQILIMQGIKSWSCI